MHVLRAIGQTLACTAVGGFVGGAFGTAASFAVGCAVGFAANLVAGMIRDGGHLSDGESRETMER
jgi:hypothetical protein